MPKSKRFNQAFTLIEISIVVVIIGLLLGGVLVANSMKNSSRLQRVMVEKEAYIAATNQFKEKYKGLPGDLFNATNYWPVAGSCPYGASSGQTTCNGNGNGKIAADLTTTEMAEAHRAWRQLMLAGLIEGQYTGQFESSGTVIATPGVRVPESVYNNAGWHLYYIGEMVSNADLFDGEYGHILYLGMTTPKSSNAGKGIMSGEDILYLDEKYDDGKVATGIIRSGKNTGIYGGACVTSDDAATATYNLNDAACVPIFLTTIN